MYLLDGRLRTTQLCLIVGRTVRVLVDPRLRTQLFPRLVNLSCASRLCDSFNNVRIPLRIQSLETISLMSSHSHLARISRMMRGPPHSHFFFLSFLLIRADVHLFLVQHIYIFNSPILRHVWAKPSTWTFTSLERSISLSLKVRITLRIRATSSIDITRSYDDFSKA